MNHICLGPDRYLFCDLFIARDRVVFVSMIYPDIEIDFAAIRCHCLGGCFSFGQIHVHRVYESSVVGMLDDPRIAEHLAANGALEVTIQYRDIWKAFVLRKETLRPCALSMFTLFRRDAYLLESWIDYYRLKGVEQFYLYYNGPLREIRKWMERFQGQPVSFIEWSYRHRIRNYDRTKLVAPDLAKNHHHAQVTAIQDCIHRYGPLTEWLAMFDLDEYVLCDDLRGFTARFDPGTTHSIWFSGVWAEADGVDKHRLTWPDLRQSTIRVSPVSYRYPRRGKNIVNPRNILNCGIHDVTNPAPGTRVVHAERSFLHFYMFSARDRGRGTWACPQLAAEAGYALG